MPRGSLVRTPHSGGLGGTYAGSPIACVAALAVIDVIEEENLLERANQIGRLFEHNLVQLQKVHPSVIGDIRANRGAMIAMELVKSGDPDQPDAELTSALVKKASQNGLILLSCGVRGNVIRFLPALTISDDLINEGMETVTRCLNELVT